MKDFLNLYELDIDFIDKVFESAARFKLDLKNGSVKEVLKGKILAMIFEKSSTRTRVSFEAGMMRLGGSAVFLSKADIQLGRGESIEDTGRVLERYCDAIMIRTFEYEKINKLATSVNIPIINGLTDFNHPSQVLSDYFTIKEHFGQKKVKIAYIGDGNNVANSLLFGAALFGYEIAIASPQGYEIKEEVIDIVEGMNKAEGFSYKITNDIKEALTGASVVYTDVWISMGQEKETHKKIQFEGYQINNDTFAMANSDAIFMHCLPAHRGEEVSDDVIDSSRSVVFLQAENRLYVQMAVLIHLFGLNY